MREVCLLIATDGGVRYADASDSPIALADSRARWQAIWALRGELAIIAHSHPLGPPAFSAEDLSTMNAIDSALGRALQYCVVAPASVVSKTGDDPPIMLDPEPWWATLARLASAMHTNENGLRT